MSLFNELDSWEEQWTSQSDGMNPKMRDDLDSIIREFFKESKTIPFYQGLLSKAEIWRLGRDELCDALEAEFHKEIDKRIGKELK